MTPRVEAYLNAAYGGFWKEKLDHALITPKFAMELERDLAAERARVAELERDNEFTLNELHRSFSRENRTHAMLRTIDERREPSSFSRRPGAQAAWDLLRKNVSTAESRASALLEVLRELVACKDLKGQINAFAENVASGAVVSESNHIVAMQRWKEYDCRQPAAWTAARSLIAEAG